MELAEVNGFQGTLRKWGLREPRACMEMQNWMEHVIEGAHHQLQSWEGGIVEAFKGFK